jgi:hypothetical protein
MDARTSLLNFLLFLAILCCAAWFLFFNAADLADKLNWASTVCSAAPSLCHNPQPLAYSAEGFVVLWLVIRFVSTVLD